jgi:Sulfotransferase domain
MRQVTYRGATFELSEAHDEAAFFVLSVRKCGSSILNKMITALATQRRLPFVDVTGELFKAGIPPDEWRSDADAARLFDGGNVYGGFRDCPLAIRELPLFVGSKKILLIRDPRDALVSEYFSNAYSHPIPKEGNARELLLRLRERALASSIESNVIQRAKAMRRTMMDYVPLLPDPHLKLFRYEDIIARKRNFLEDICRHFGWPVLDKGIDRVLEWADVFPDEERPTEFIRRVLPGDHREKLSADGIAQLNVLLEEPLRAFGYAA